MCEVNVVYAECVLCVNGVQCRKVLCVKRFDVLEGGCGLEGRVMCEECKMCEEGVMWEEG